jgi:hypothetical protein
MAPGYRNSTLFAHGNAPPENNTFKKIAAMETRSPGKKAATGTDRQKRREEDSRAKAGYLGTRIVDDVFTDAAEMLKTRFEYDYNSYIDMLWNSNPEIRSILESAADLESARDSLYTYLDRAERKIFAVDNDLHILEKATVRECIRVFRSILGPINEKRTETSALRILWELARDREVTGKDVSIAFLMEFINLFRGVAGMANIYYESEGAKKGSPISCGSRAVRLLRHAQGSSMRSGRAWPSISGSFPADWNRK